MAKIRRFLATSAVLITAAGIFAACESRGNSSAPMSFRREDGFWKTATAKSDTEINPSALAAHLALCKRTGADACLVVHHDRIVQEWYGPRYKTPAYAMSSTKSVTGLLTGMLIADGRIKNLDVTVCSYLPAWCSGHRSVVTLRHLLTMTSGLPMMQDGRISWAPDRDAYVTGLVPKFDTGQLWIYSNEGAQLLSPILDLAAQEPIQDYAQRRLFKPLGMRNTRLHVEQGRASTYADMETTARDFARLGVLALHHGQWQGKQIVSSDWLAQSTRPSQTLNSRYGLLWWIDPEVRGYAMHGYLATHLHVIPDLDLVIVRMQFEPVAGLVLGEYEDKGLKLFRSIVRLN